MQSAMLKCSTCSSVATGACFHDPGQGQVKGTGKGVQGLTRWRRADVSRGLSSVPCRYLQTSFEEAIKKLLRFLGRYSQSDCNKFAMCVAYVTASQLAPMSVLSTLFMDHLVKEGTRASERERCVARIDLKKKCRTRTERARRDVALWKPGLSLQFMTTLLRTYLAENTFEHLTANLKKNGLEDKVRAPPDGCGAWGTRTCTS